MRCPVRHIFMPVNQTINGICIQHTILLKNTIQSHKVFLQTPTKREMFDC